MSPKFAPLALCLTTACGTSMPTCDHAQQTVGVDTPIDQGRDAAPWTLGGWQDAVSGPFALDVPLPDGGAAAATLTIDVADEAEFTDAVAGQTHPLSPNLALIYVECHDSLAADVTVVLSAPGLPDLSFTAQGTTADAASISATGPVDAEAARAWVGEGTEDAARIDRVVAAGRTIDLRVEVNTYQTTGAGIALIAWEGDTLSRDDDLFSAGTLATP